MSRKYNRENRRISAEKRQLSRSGRSAKAQLAVLDKRLGKNRGAIKERLRLEGEMKNG